MWCFLPVQQIETFLLQMSDDHLANALFQLAICGGSLAVPHNLVPQDKASTASEQANGEDKAATSLPGEGISTGHRVLVKRLTNLHAHDLFLLCRPAKLKQFLRDSLSSQSSTFTLANMASLEKKLIKHFQVKDFLSLENGTFLEFLAKHVQVKTWAFLRPPGAEGHKCPHRVSVWLCAGAEGLPGLCGFSGSCRWWFQADQTRCV